MIYQARLERLQKLLTSASCDALMISDAINLYYMTGLELSAGKLLVDLKGAHLFVDGRYYEQCIKKSPFSVHLAEKTPLAELLSQTDFNFIKTLAFSAEETSFKGFKELELLIHDIRQYSRGHRKLTLVPLENPVKVLRTIKDPEEIGYLKEAANLGSEGFDYVCTLLKEGISEAEVAMELEIFWKRRGSKKVAFDPIIAFGANGSMPHYRAGNARLEKGQGVLIDIGVNYKHYHSDMTRVVYFGTPPEQLSVIYSVVQHAQKHALAKCRPGVLVGDLDAAARNFIESQGYGEFFTHSLGHGVGLDIHELPVLRNKPPYDKTVLEPGMVITIEPGIYLGGVGGVRLEDTVVITENGYENLTNRSTEPVTLSGSRSS